MTLWEDVLRYVSMRLGMNLPGGVPFPDTTLLLSELGEPDNPNSTFVKTLDYALRNAIDSLLEYSPRQTLQVVNRVDSTTLPAGDKYVYEWPRALNPSSDEYIDASQITRVYPFATVAQTVGKFGVVLSSVLTVGWMWPHADAFVSALIGFDTIDKVFRGVFTWRLLYEQDTDGNLVPRLVISVTQPHGIVAVSGGTAKLVVRHTVKLRNLEPIDVQTEDLGKIFMLRQAEKEYIRSYVAKEFLTYLMSVRGSFKFQQGMQDFTVEPSIELLGRLREEEDKRLNDTKKKIQAAALLTVFT